MDHGYNRREIREAMTKNVFLPHAMSLSTVGLSGQPSSRMVLLKGLFNEGIVFFTDYSSQKGIEIENNTKAALNFWWAQTEKQIRIEGNCSKTTLEESNNYFQSRPRKSQVSAYVSLQSEEIKSYEHLTFFFFTILTFFII